MNAFQLDGLPHVNLDDDLFGVFHQRVRAADRSAGDDVALLVDADGLDHGHVDLAEVAVLDEKRHLRQMHVHISHLVVVRQRAQVGVALVGIAAGDHAGTGQRTVDLVADGGAGDKRDADLLSLLGALGQRHRHGLGIAGQREAAHADGHAVLDELRGGGRRGDLGLDFAVADAVVHEKVPPL